MFQTRCVEYHTRYYDLQIDLEERAMFEASRMTCFLWARISIEDRDWRRPHP